MYLKMNINMKIKKGPVDFKFSLQAFFVRKIMRIHQGVTNESESF